MSQQKERCMIPDCKDEVRAFHLCNRHYKKKQKGMTLEAIVRGDRPASLGHDAPFSTRITPAARARLARWAKSLGFKSPYKLGSHVLETWSPPTEEPKD